IASAQGTLQGLRTANALLHFSNNTVGHAHFATYGFVAFLMFGAIYGESLFGEAAKARLHPRLVFWLSLGGMALYVGAMPAAGVLQGLSWAAEEPFIDSVVANAPWYLLRAVGGSAMALGHLLLAWDLWLMRPQPAPRLAPLASPEPAQ